MSQTSVHYPQFPQGVCWIMIFFLDVFFYFLRSCAACRTLVPQPGIKSRPRQWQHWVLTTGPPGNSLGNGFKITKYWSEVFEAPVFWPFGPVTSTLPEAMAMSSSVWPDLVRFGNVDDPSQTRLFTVCNPSCTFSSSFSHFPPGSALLAT